MSAAVSGKRTNKALRGAEMGAGESVQIYFSLINLPS